MLEKRLHHTAATMVFTLIQTFVQSLISLRTAQCSNYGRRKPQVAKEDLYMLTALWMQESPWAMKSTPDLNVVGSVFVLPNVRVLTADCTRQHPDDNTLAVHGAIRPLIKYPDKVEGCQVYLTRKPCAHCVKMLVQARVSKVFYLPLQPEKPLKKDAYENKSVDVLFQVSEVSKSVYVPNISQQYIDELENQKAPYNGNTVRKFANTFSKKIEEFEEKQKWNEYWYSLPQKYQEGKQPPSKLEQDLDWQEYGDEKIAEQVQKDMGKAFEWFCKATFATGDKDEMKWEQIGKKWGERPSYDPKEVTHLSRLAQMLSNRTDDPNRGVGCVIVDGEEIVSIGWNGFPSKALYGNHPRGSDNDLGKPKYPHVIHAEQNALLSRNQRDLKDSMVYVDKIPCNDCMSMLYELGVERVVLPPFDENKLKDSEKCFEKLLNEKQIRVLRYQPT